MEEAPCIVEAWGKWGCEQGLWQEVQQRQVWLAKLTEEEMQARHERQDHVPFRKGCPICVAAQGRQRSHWRASKSGVYSASFDLAGPYVSGHSFDATASGRDRGTGYKYFVACAFTVPLEPSPECAKPLSDPDIHDSGEGEASLTDETDELELPDMAELFPPDTEGEICLQEVEGAREMAVHHCPVKTA